MIITDRLKRAKDLMDSEYYEPAIDILTDLNNLPLNYDNLRLLFLSNCLYNTKDYYSAIDTAGILLQRDHKNEYASQLKYLSYCELGDFDNALNEAIKFLSDYKASLYKVTLKELLTDVKNGFITREDTRYKIKELAVKNNVYLDDCSL